MLMIDRTRGTDGARDERPAGRDRPPPARPALRGIVCGLVAGAVGTTALNAVTYMDMAIRPRPASTTPELTVRRLEELAHLTLSSRGVDSDDAAHRRSGLGGLLGIAAGLGVGTIYGLLRPRLGRVPRALLGVGVGVLANIGTSGPMTLLGVTDPRTWTASSWVSDVAPHLVYGFATAEVWRMLDPTRSVMSDVGSGAVRDG